jgi:putative flippase GtrA
MIMKSSETSSRHALYEFVRFLLAGGVNTALSYGVYLLTLLVFPYKFAYTISFLAGIALSYWLTSRFVFQRGLSLRSAIQYPLVYLFQYVMGLIILTLLVERFHMKPRWAPVIVVVCTIPMTFFLSRFVIKGSRHDRDKSIPGPLA